MPELDDSDVQATAAPPAPVLAPGVPRGSSGAPLPPPPPPAMWTNAAQPPVAPPMGVGGDFMQGLRARVSNLPLDQAEQAVSAALKFQAVRGYQSDLSAGKDPAESLAKWAPMMFTAPKSATLGQAASLVRARQAPKPMNVGGIAYRLNPDGSMTPLTPGRTPAPNTFDTLEFRETLKQIGELEKDLAAAPYGKEADEKRWQRKSLLEKAAEIRSRGTKAAPAGPTGTGTSAPPGPPKITSKEDYDSLPSGAIYIGKNGRRYRKP